MSNYVIVQPGIAGFTPVSQTDSYQRFAPLITVTGSDLGASWPSSVTTGTTNQLGFGQFVYCAMSTLSAAGNFVVINQGSTGATAVALGTAGSASLGPIGVAMAAASTNATTTMMWGWVQVAGLNDIGLASNVSHAAGIPLYLASTAGQIPQSSSNAGQRVFGVQYVNSHSAASSQICTIALQNPYIAGATAIQ